MAKTRPKRKRKTLTTGTIPITDVSGNFPNLHHELGTGETADGRKMRFLQHINLGCFWLQIGDEMYQVNTQDLMNAICVAVLDKE